MRMDKLLNHMMSLVPSPRVYWLLFLVTFFQLGLSPAKAQNYPSKSVKIVVPSPPVAAQISSVDYSRNLLLKPLIKAFLSKINREPEI